MSTQKSYLFLEQDSSTDSQQEGHFLICDNSIPSSETIPTHLSFIKLKISSIPTVAENQNGERKLNNEMVSDNIKDEFGFKDRTEKTFWNECETKNKDCEKKKIRVVEKQNFFSASENNNIKNININSEVKFKERSDRSSLPDEVAQQVVVQCAGKYNNFISVLGSGPK